MKPIVRGKSIFLREVKVSDAEFILNLRTLPPKAMHISPNTGGLEAQKLYIQDYFASLEDFYFVICDWEGRRLGTLRIYGVRGESFAWGSWILSDSAPAHVAIESALLVYDFAFFALHYAVARLAVRHENSSVLRFHEYFGAKLVGKDSESYHFALGVRDYLDTRGRFQRFLPSPGRPGSSV